MGQDILKFNLSQNRKKQTCPEKKALYVFSEREKTR